MARAALPVSNSGDVTALVLEADRVAAGLSRDELLRLVCFLGVMLGEFASHLPPERVEFHLTMMETSPLFRDG